MKDQIASALKSLEGFEILPPEFTNAVNGTLEFEPAPAREPVTVKYPGLREAVPGLEEVSVGIYGDSWGSRATPMDAQREEVIEGYAPAAVLNDSASYRIWAVARFKIAGEESPLTFRSADRQYRLKRKEAR
ncbi:hypothetical protein ACIPW4_06190 [Pseudomonas sp. NPDC089996]|uniref:hypothetical protein n=1 Tax=Pseudomonas sp. NPDC089996 TaxID=3364474 RepID=UPI00380E8F05